MARYGPRERSRPSIHSTTLISIHPFVLHVRSSTCAAADRICEAVLVVPANFVLQGASRNGATFRRSPSHRTVCKQTRGRELKFWVSCHLHITAVAPNA